MDEPILLFFNQTLSSTWLDIFFAWISQSLFFSVPLLLFVLVFFAWKFGKEGVQFWLLVIVLIAVGDQLGALLKYLIAQPRPCAQLGDIVRQTDTLFHINCSHRLNGMPSNHALNFFLFASFTGFVLRWRMWVLSFVVLAVLVAISRVYLGVHYPSQVLLGAVLGTVLGGLAAWLGTIYFPLVQRISRTSQLQQSSIP